MELKQELAVLTDLGNSMAQIELLGFSFQIELGEGLSRNSLRMCFPELSVPRFCCSSFISGEINLFQTSLFLVLDFWLLILP